MEAAIVVGRLFPPAKADDTFCILAALNLLNAAVKTAWGRQHVGYHYIKGMAACLFSELCRHPQKGVSIYHDSNLHVTYFRVFGVQISFHHLSHYADMQKAEATDTHQRQEWDGIRLQEIAVELFRLAVPMPPTPTPAEARQACHEMLHWKQAGHSIPYEDTTAISGAIAAKADIQNTDTDKKYEFREDKLKSLQEALAFNIWDRDSCKLFRRKDRRFVHIMRYDGDNYKTVMEFVTRSNPIIPYRREATMEKDKYYYLSAKKRLRAVSLSNYISMLSHNNYLISDGNYSNLCVTYNIALYLASLFHGLQFVSTIQYNRRKNQRQYYAYKQLCRVPLGSDERRLKIWLPIDIGRHLPGFRPEYLPRPLIDEYLAAEDYYQEFQFIYQDGLTGIIAYRRYILLPPLFLKIRIRNYYAYTMRTDTKWAIYSLRQEKFVSDFVYDRIWFDYDKYIICGAIGSKTVVIYEFFSEERGKKRKK